MKSKILIIAEAGVNHNGSLKKAKKLVDIAKWAGADIVKFQTFDASEIVTRSAKKANYQNRSIGKKKSQHQMLEKLSLDSKMHFILSNYAKSKKIEFLSTGFDINNLKMLLGLGIKRIKIPSGEITNMQLLEFAAKQKLPIILSTGMSNLKEIQDAIKILNKHRNTKSSITVLHCTSEYPAPLNEANILVLKTLIKKLKTSVGYSDHTLGVEASIGAVALGAKIIEKHFTINRNSLGPDHKTSLDPHQLKTFIKSIRNIDKALGNKEKKVTKSEKKNKFFSRRSLVALKLIKKGEVFNLKNIGAKRPGKGISPMKIYTLLGKKSKYNYKIDQTIKKK